MIEAQSPVKRFQAYLDKAANREVFRVVCTALAVLLALLLFITLSATGIGLFRGFTPTLTNVARVGLGLGLLYVVVKLLWMPISALRKNKTVTLVETADAAFDGRVQTYVDTKTRTPKHPFLPLLAKDALRVSQRVPLHRVVPTGLILWPVFFLGLLVASAVFFVMRAPEPWLLGAEHVWRGWQKPGLVQPREIIATPGHIEVLSGENLNLTASLSGFSTPTVLLHAKDGDEPWQSTELSANEEGGFDFTVFRVVKPLQYYFSASYTKTEQFNVSVVVPARLERLNASYEYPEWTKLNPYTDHDATLISAVKGTQVTLSIRTDKPMQQPHLQVGDQQLGLEAKGNQYSVSFTVNADTHYQLMDRLLDRNVPISGEFGIVVRGDEPPQIKFEFPGRDVSASPVEEVQVKIRARDDFALESVELLYSINAGEWQSVDLGTEELSEYVFYTENLGTSEDTTQTVPMHPGDLISYYARAKDHDSVAETDMMLIDIRPFERQFSQGDSGGSGGESGPANEGSEISKRQKEILIATWNMQRAVEANGGNASAHEDNAKLLAELQTTLAEQARTLAQRTEARALDQQGDEIREFVVYLREAADAMEPSANALETLDFADAIQPQQLALQLLQRAEALFANFRMSQQEGQGSGSSQPGKDMAEMFELEMDLERNQYEQPDKGQAQDPSEKMDDIFDKLTELAHRQQAVEEARKNKQQEEPTPEERWQQEQLSRELEALRKELEALEQEAKNSDQASSSNTAQAAKETAEKIKQAQEALQQAEAAERNKQQAEENQQNVAEADASSDDQEATETSEGDASAQNSASDAATKALQEAVDTLAEQRAKDLQSGLATATNIANDILNEQRQTEQVLRDAIERAVQSRSAGVYSPGLEVDEARALAERKRELQRELQQLKSDLTELDKRFGDQAQATSDELKQALKELDISQAEAMLGIAGDAIESGSLATVLPSESIVTNAVREFRDRLSEAAEEAAGEKIQTKPNTDLQVADALDQLRELRTQVEDVTKQASGQSQNNEQSTPNGQGQDSESPQEGAADQGQEGQGQEGQGQEGQGQEGQGQEGQGQEGQGQEGQGQEGQGQEGQGQEGQGQEGQGQEGQGQEGQGQEGQGQEGQGQEGQGQEGQGQEGQGQEGQGLAQASGQSSAQSQSSSQASAGEGSGSSEESAQGVSVNDVESGLAQQTAEAIEELLPKLNELGADAAILDDLQASAGIIRQSGTGVNATRIESEYQRILRSLDELELSMTQANRVDQQKIEQWVREGEISEAAADYFRRLSEQKLKR